MMKYLKRLSALLIALAIFFTAIPVSAFYEDDEAVTLNEVQETDYSSAENVDMSFELLILPQYESGTTYSFTYDGFARNVSTKVGSRTLSSYTYNARSLPQTMTYGNGVVVSYGYDNLNRQTEFYVNNWLKYEYNYDGYSRLSELVDYSLHRKMKYEYDILSRPASEKVIDAFTNYIVSKLSLRYDDSKNRLAGYDVTIGGTTNSTDYTYGGTGIAPDLITGVNRNGIRKISYIYDGLNRLSTRNLNNFFTEYTYLQGATSNSTTTLVESVKNGDETLSYTYDDLGNITSISKNGTLIESYTYNDLNMLKTVTKDNDVYTYTYDGGGNIKSVKKNGTTVKTYTYGDSQWKDLLTAYNGQTITYDNIGNPLTYYNGSTFTWGNGRKLTNITNGTNTYSYQYDSNGLRTTKTVNGTTTEYYWLDGMLYAQKTGNKYIYFHYDETGTAYGFTVEEGTTSADYYYMHNLQGDVIGIFDSVGEDTIVRYTYDEWGKVLTITGDQANTIGQLNPIRYRGYYYDTETGFYYCRSRYYDPEICRWINGDVLLDASYTIGLNVYSYCGNNSIVYADDLGFGRTYVIYYDNPIRGFKKQAMNSPYYDVNDKDVFLINVSSNKDFIDAWNSMEETVDYIYLYLHGGEGELYFKDEALGFSGDQSFNDLESIHVNNAVYLFSCKGGAGKENNNVAFMFAKLTNTKVYACTGSVSYSKIFGEYYARKAKDFGVIKTFFYQKKFIFFGKSVAKTILGQW